MDNNQTNTEKADEVAGYFGYLGEIPGKQSPYVSFLTATPEALTSMAVLVENAGNGTADRHDYVHAMTSLGQVGVGVAGLLVVAEVIIAPAALPILVGIGLGLAVLDYADEHNYDINEIMDDLASKAKDLGELLGEVIPDGQDVEAFLSELGAALNELIDAIPDADVLIDGILEGLQATLPGGLASLFGDLIDGISAEINELWAQAQNWVMPHDPLVLDLDGDGVETFGITAETQVLFDSNGNGIKTATGWVSSDDGILVLDRNGNGIIDDGSELFGDQTIVNGVKAKNGFEALSAEDTNGNGLFDAGDANFENVKVWRDFDGDGISDEGELFSLSELGIASIDLSSNATSSSSNGIKTATGWVSSDDGELYSLSEAA